MAQATETETESSPTPEQPKGLLRRAWDGIRGFAATGFFKGALVTAALVVGVTALVAGAMGAGAISGLAVGGIPVITFEAGLGEGISKGLEFLTQSALGWATLGVGGALGAYREMRRNQKQEQDKGTDDRAAKLLELTQGVGQQKAVEEPQPEMAQPEPVQHHHHHHHTKHTREVENTHFRHTQVISAEHGPEAQGKDTCPDGIYLANSTVKGQGFSASELKRRVERETTDECKTV